MVDRDQLLYLVDALKAQLPAEIEESKTIIDNCNALRTNAKKDAAETRREADRVLNEAEERAVKLVEETNIVKLAKIRQDEILADAEDKKEKLISGALDYADRIIEEAQHTVTVTLDTLNAGMDVLQRKCQEELAASMMKLNEARAALKSVAESDKK